MGLVLEDILLRDDPDEPAAPVLVDCPYAGNRYPDDFVCNEPASVLRQSQDVGLEALLAPAPEMGATLLYPLMARQVIDVTRPPDSSNGGDRERIDRYLLPYRYQLATILDTMVGRFGVAWHLRCLTAPWGETGPDKGPDFALTGCTGPRMAEVMGMKIREMGYSLTVTPPGSGPHPLSATRSQRGLTVTLARRLYLNDDSTIDSAGFITLQNHLAALISTACDVAMAQATVAQQFPSAAAE